MPAPDGPKLIVGTPLRVNVAASCHECSAPTPEERPTASAALIAVTTISWFSAISARG